MATVYRADHVGSLVRPAAVLQAKQEHAAGKLSADDLRRIEDDAILDVLRMQHEVGIDVCSDGEFRRSDWWGSLMDAVEGFVEGGIKLTIAQRAVGGRLRQVRRLAAVDAAFLKEHAPGPYKVTVPAAATFAYLFYEPGVTDRFYASRAELLADLTNIVRDELVALADEGVPYIQVDAPRYTYFLDERLRQRLRDNDIDPEAAFAASLDSDNVCLRAARRADNTLAVHFCRGNMRGTYFASGSYEPIAERLFSALEVDRFLLEYDTDRSGGFEPLRFIPRGKTAVLGLVSTKTPELESQDALLRRIDEASKFIPLENHAISPQCGFASSEVGAPLTEDQQRRKLELVAETARRVWG
jgi:5-methyltetrahydropteroyltriglutamate--homocysteine methyltransferase